MSKVNIFIPLFSVVMIVGLSINASASIIDDIPDGINDVLFDGNPSTLVIAKNIIGALILCLFVVLLAYSHLDKNIIALTTLPIMGILVMMTWLEIWILLFGGLMIAVLFSAKISEWITMARSK